MFADFLTHVLTASRINGGCGMSTRPSFYSGRGATAIDLCSSRLEKIWTAIQKHAGQAAADAFVEMVAAMPKLSATDFLLTLSRLEASGWQWSPALLGREAGVYVTDEGSAWGTVLSRYFSSDDETETIREPFLRQHGIRVPRRHYTSSSL